MSEKPNLPEARVTSIETGRVFTPQEVRRAAREQKTEEQQQQQEYIARQVGRRSNAPSRHNRLRKAAAIIGVTLAFAAADTAYKHYFNNNSQTEQPLPSLKGSEAEEILSEISADKMFTGSLILDLSKARPRRTPEVTGEDESSSNIMEDLRKAKEINGVEIPEGTEFIKITWPIEKKDLRGNLSQSWIIMTVRYEGENEIKTVYVADSKPTRKGGIVKIAEDGIFSKIEETPGGKKFTQVGQGIIMQEQMGKVTPIPTTP